MAIITNGALVFVFGLLFVGAVLFLLRTRLYALLLKIAPPQYRVNVNRGIQVMTRDGVPLITDHYAPDALGSFPTILIRSPYGREPKHGNFGLILNFFAYRFAERGYHVVTQDTRGRFSSGGEFDPYFNERNDGLDTLDWLKQQTWYNGVLGMWGPSYLGIVQYALATVAPEIRAMVPSITTSRLVDVILPDGVLDLGLVIRWIGIFQALDRGNGLPLWRGYSHLLELEKIIAPAFASLPLATADAIVTGSSVPFFQKWLSETSPESTLWQYVADDMRLDQISADTLLIGGWYDFFLRAQLRDYTELVAAGKKPYLTVGPWSHFTHSMIMPESLQEGLDWFDATLKHEHGKLRDKPVKLYVMGAKQWHTFDQWPPPSQETRLFLQAEFGLSTKLPVENQPADHYTYDPADPTPAVGGTQFSYEAGPTSNRQLEARPDVLVYTTNPLTEPLEVIGYVRLTLYVQSSAETTDFFGRLCDVDPNGESINICDGLFRITPMNADRQPDGTTRVEVDMWATAYRFAVGHQLRLQVSSGAHPRWNRNLGKGTFSAADTEMIKAEQTIYHDSQHPSVLVLPVVSNGQV